MESICLIQPRNNDGEIVTCLPSKTLGDEIIRNIFRIPSPRGNSFGSFPVGHDIPQPITGKDHECLFRRCDSTKIQYCLSDVWFPQHHVFEAMVSHGSG